MRDHEPETASTSAGRSPGHPELLQHGHPFRQWKTCRIPGTDLTLVGYSRANDKTFFHIPELRCSLDAGQCEGRRPDTVFLTHTHHDHSKDLDFLAANPGGTEIYLPAEAAPYVESYLRASAELNHGAGFDPALARGHRLHGVRRDDEFVFGRQGHHVRVVECDHKVPCVGYAFSHWRKALRPEFEELRQHLTPGEFGRLVARKRKDGVEVEDRVRRPLFAFLGDTRDAAGIVALGRLAIHTGDARQARRLGEIAHVMLEQGTPAVRRHARWLLALFAMAEGDAEGARDRLRAPSDPGGRPILPRFPLDIADEAMLARIALATKDDELAQLALVNSRRRAELNPDVASIAATAAQVRGLLEPSHADLREAVDLFARTPRRLELAAALEDLGGERVAPDREAAIEILGRSLALYTELGATWDARRVRHRLHELGVRRRIVTAEPETHGWTALTTSELAVARLVADGLTNREVADRLFVSPHTVNSHLRHVFTKLGINSRVELARLAHKYDMA